MKIRALKSVAGYWPGFQGGSYSFYPGQVVAVPDGLAKSLIQAGHATATIKVQRRPVSRKSVKVRETITLNSKAADK